MAPSNILRFGRVQGWHGACILVAIAWSTTVAYAQGPSLLDRLIIQLKDSNPAFRGSAAAALVRMGPQAVEPLIAVLNDPSYRFHEKTENAVTWTLGELKDPRAVAPLLRALEDPDPAFQHDAGLALARIRESADANGPLHDSPQGGERLANAIKQALGEGWEPGPQAVEPLIAALKSQDYKVRSSAAYALGRIKDPRAIGPLIAASSSPGVYDPSRALVEIGKPAVGPLIAALRNPNPDIRDAAASTLGMIKDPRAVAPLITALKDPEITVQGSAATALIDIRGPAAVAPLVAALKDANAKVRENAAIAPIQEGSLAVDALLTLLKDPLPAIRQRVASVLGEIKDPLAERNLLAAFNEPRWEVIAGAISFFVGRGESGSEDVLIETLSRTGSRDVAQALLNSRNPKLESAARKWSVGRAQIHETISGNSVPWGSRR